MAARPVWAGGSSARLPPHMGSGGGRGGGGAPAEGGGGPGGGGGGGGPPMFIGGGITGGATESTAGWPWKGEPGGEDRHVKMEKTQSVYMYLHLLLFEYLSSNALDNGNIF